MNACKNKKQNFLGRLQKQKAFFPQPHSSLLHTHMQASAVKTARTNFIMKSKYKHGHKQ